MDMHHFARLEEKLAYPLCDRGVATLLSVRSARQVKQLVDALHLSLSVAVSQWTEADSWQQVDVCWVTS